MKNYLISFFLLCTSTILHAQTYCMPTTNNGGYGIGINSVTLGNETKIIDKISNDAIDYLKEENKERLGSLMYKNQYFLKKLGVSTPKIDDMVSYIKNKYKIFGTKLTGGGRGGSLIILADDYEKIISDLNKKGFKNYLVSLGAEGVRKI